MPASRRLYVNTVKDDTVWTGGEYGLLPPWAAPAHSFTGTNVMRYVGGAIGPRYGVISLATSGLSPTGKIGGMGYNPSAGTNPDVWFTIGAQVYLLNSSTGVITNPGALGVTPTATVRGVALSPSGGAVTYLGNDGDGVYKLDHVAGTLTLLTGSPTNCAIILQYGAFIFTAGQNTNQIRYDEPLDPTTWTASNFINVGFGGRITGMWGQRDHIVIATSDGGWWTLKGVPTSAAAAGNAVLRRMGDIVSPLYPENAHILGDGVLAFTFGSSATGSQASLGEFSGSIQKMIPYLFFGDGRSVTFPDLSHQVQGSKEQADWFVFGSKAINPNEMLMKTRGTWSHHTFAISGVSLSSYMAGNAVNDVWVLTDGGGTGVTPKFYKWRQYANRPGFTGDSNAQPGDASTTPFSASFTTEETTSEVGYEVQVMEVAVDFLEWTTGSSSSNHFDISVTTSRAFQDGSSTPSSEATTNTRSYDGNNGTTGGTRHRVRFGFSDAQPGNGYRINFTNIRGVAIERVLVHQTNQLTRQ